MHCVDGGTAMAVGMGVAKGNGAGSTELCAVAVSVFALTVGSGGL